MTTTTHDEIHETQWRPLVAFVLLSLAAICIVGMIWAQTGRASDYQTAFSQWSSIQPQIKLAESRITQAKASYDVLQAESCKAATVLRLEALKADLSGEKKLTVDERSRIKGLIATNDCEESKK